MKAKVLPLGFLLMFDPLLSQVEIKYWLSFQDFNMFKVEEKLFKLF